MYKAFGIVNSSGRNIYVDGMQDYRRIFLPWQIQSH